MARVFPTQKFGYIEIKQSSKVRPRKLKSWKRRWAVLTQMSNLSSEEYVVKLDLYDNDSKWRTNSSDKMTLVLENVTCIRPVRSKTHQHAFEVVENHPVLVISGATELESYSWILSLQQIFTPDQVEAKKDCYQVTISANEHSDRWSLSGDYNLTVCSTCISLARKEEPSVISWGLNTLIKFNVKQSPEPVQGTILVIECGPNAPTGQSCFHFLSPEAQDILSAIRQSICFALALKQSARNVPTTRPRTLSATISEKGFQKLLDSYSAPQFVPTNMSDSCSSGSTAVGSLTSTSRLSSSPVSPSVINRLSTDRVYVVEMNENIKAKGFELTEEPKQTEDATACERVGNSVHKRSSSQPDKSCGDSKCCSEHRHDSEDHKPVLRRITLGCEPSDYDLNRLRSISDVFASIGGVSDHSNWRSFKGESDDKSDLDSAISSLALSAANDEPPRTDELVNINSDSSDVFQHAYSSHRRRSSSTPDLQAYRKLHENVYEELDELRDSVQRLNMKRDIDIPPELPARPFLADFRYTGHLNTNSAAAEKRSILQWYRQVSYDDAREKSTAQCTCESSKGTRSRFDSSGQCISCGNKACTQQANPNSKASDKKMHVNYSLADINDIILQVQNMKRRRSSDITPVASSFLLSTLIPDTNNSKASNHFYWEDPERLPRNSNARETLITSNAQENMKISNAQENITSNTQENLINIEDKADLFDLGIEAPIPFSKSAQDNPSDLWMHFPFTDTFDWNPVVTEECPSSNHEHLLQDSSSLSVDPVSNGLTPSRTLTWSAQDVGNDAADNTNCL